jgi:hypothetical protein
LDEIKLEKDSNNVNKLCNDFTEKVSDIIKKFLPFKTCRVKFDKLDKWITPDIINLMGDRDKAKHCMIAAKKQNLDSVVYFENLYKSLRNNTVYAISKSKETFVHKKILECGRNSDNLWSFLKRTIPAMDSKSRNLVNLNLTADDFNDYFTTELLILTQDLNPTNVSQYYELQVCDQQIIVSDTFSIHLITEGEISKIINNFPAKKAVGSDGKPMRFLKLFKFSLLTHLVMIINLSFTNSIIPSFWNISKVIPIYKKGSKKICSNFRPISLLPIFSKIMEKYVHDLLLEYLEKYKFL